MARTARTVVKFFFAAAFVAFGSFPAHSFACSPLANTSANFVAGNAAEKISVPGAPLVSIERITRGGDRPDSCSDIGLILLSIKPDRFAAGYAFEVIKGKNPADGFDGKAIVGYESNGKQVFQFIWNEPGKAPPLDFKLRVTAYSKTGNKGGFSIIHIHDNGRK